MPTPLPPFCAVLRGCALAAWAAALLSACQPKAPPPEPVRAVRTQVVSAAVAVPTLTLAGDVRARHESALGFEVPGRITARQVGLGERVRKGQVLAQLDVSDLQLARDAAQAAAAAAATQLKVAQADQARNAALRDQGFIGAAQMQRIDAAAAAAKAQADQAQAQAQVQANRAAQGSLRAPSDGVITAVMGDVGQVVGAGSPVMRFAADGPRDVVASVPQGDRALWAARVGQPGAVQVTLTDGGRAFMASVRELAASADPVSRTFTLRAQLDGAVEPPPLGSTVTVTLTQPPASASAADAGVVLPLSAVWDQGGQAQVWKLDPHRMQVHAQAVKLAPPRGEQVRVLEGLQAGDEVVTAGTHVLTQGQAVRRYAPGQAAQ